MNQQEDHHTATQIAAERDVRYRSGGIDVWIHEHREIVIHESLVALGHDWRTLDTPAELADNPDLAREASYNPMSFAEARGIPIPANMTLQLDVDDYRISLRVAYYDDFAPFVLTWDGDGFSPPGSTRSKRSRLPHSPGKTKNPAV